MTTFHGYVFSDGIHLTGNPVCKSPSSASATGALSIECTANTVCTACRSPVHTNGCTGSNVCRGTGNICGTACTASRRTAHSNINYVVVSLVLLLSVLPDALVNDVVKTDVDDDDEWMS